MLTPNANRLDSRYIVIAVLITLTALITTGCSIANKSNLGALKSEQSETTPSPKAQVAPTSQASLKFIKPKGSVTVSRGETITLQLRGQGLTQVIVTSPYYSRTVKNDGTSLFTFEFGVPTDWPSDSENPIRFMALGRTSDECLGVDPGCLVESENVISVRVK